MKVVLQGHIIVPQADLGVVEAALSEHVQLTRQEAGCICFEVTRDDKQPNRFNVYEEFTDRSAFERHQRRVRCSEWGEVTKNVTRDYQVQGLE
ncbi:MAG: putative quinol monooxygenase [Pseudomonadota bacterium]